MDIMLVNNLYPPRDLGGGGKSLQLLARGLSRQGTNVSIATLVPGSDRTKTQDDDITIHQIPLRNLYWPFSESGHKQFLKPIFNWFDRYNKSMKELFGKVLDEQSPDIVRSKNIYGFSTSIWDACQERDIPIVHTLGDYYLICLHASLEKNGEECQKQCWDCYGWNRHRRTSSSTIDGVTGVSEFVLRKHSDFGFFNSVENRTVIFPPFINNNSYSSNEITDKITIGFLGRIEPDKGIEVYLDAIEQLNVDRAEFIVAGEGPEDYQKQIINRMNQLGVKYLGYSDPGEFFEQTNILVVPSLVPETFGRVVLEAYQHGVPVVASRRGALKELVEDGVSGWLFEPGNVDKLVNVLSKLISNPSKLKFNREKIHHLIEESSQANVSKQYMRFFEQVLSQKTSSVKKQ